jgi:hypothetical protein
MTAPPKMEISEEFEKMSIQAEQRHEFKMMYDVQRICPYHLNLAKPFSKQMMNCCRKILNDYGGSRESFDPTIDKNFFTGLPGADHFNAAMPNWFVPHAFHRGNRFISLHLNQIHH